jgi:hypothetical protein
VPPELVVPPELAVSLEALIPPKLVAPPELAAPPELVLPPELIAPPKLVPPPELPPVLVEPPVCGAAWIPLEQAASNPKLASRTTGRFIRFISFLLNAGVKNNGPPRRPSLDLGHAADSSTSCQSSSPCASAKRAAQSA